MNQSGENLHEPELDGDEASLYKSNAHGRRSTTLDRNFDDDGGGGASTKLQRAGDPS
jgi:hypothetical protein